MQWQDPHTTKTMAQLTVSVDDQSDFRRDAHKQPCSNSTQMPSPTHGAGRCRWRWVGAWHLLALRLRETEAGPGGCLAAT